MLLSMQDNVQDNAQPLYPTVIIEADNLVREGLRLILEKTPFAVSICAKTIDDIADFEDQAVFIFFVRDKKRSSDMIIKVRDRFPDAKLVAIADDMRGDSLVHALEMGAHAAFFTGISPEGLVNSLNALIAHNVMVVDARVWPQGAPMATAIRPHTTGDAPARTQEIMQLSAREADILNRIVLGDSNKHIARHFDIAEATVKAHMKAILRKIGAINRTQAAIWAMNNGMAITDTGIDEEDDNASSPRSPASVGLLTTATVQ
jgi:two-component system, NarL family, nitrate/nitrite response regulator NarL